MRKWQGWQGWQVSCLLFDGEVMLSSRDPYVWAEVHRATPKSCCDLCARLNAFCAQAPTRILAQASGGMAAALTCPSGACLLMIANLSPKLSLTLLHERGYHTTIPTTSMCNLQIRLANIFAGWLQSHQKDPIQTNQTTKQPTSLVPWEIFNPSKQSGEVRFRESRSGTGTEWANLEHAWTFKTVLDFNDFPHWDLHPELVKKELKAAG